MHYSNLRGRWRCTRTLPSLPSDARIGSGSGGGGGGEQVSEAAATVVDVHVQRLH